MRILAIESSAGPVSVALAEDGKIINSSYRNDGLTHSATLLEMVHRVLADRALTPKDVDLFAVSAGPGSFTGLRIGIATLKGLAWGAEKPCAGVSTLLGMAYCHADWPGLVCPAMDARRGQVYTAAYRTGRADITPLLPDTAEAASEFAEKLPDDEPILVCGDGAAILYGALLQLGRSNVTLASPACRYQNAVGIALAAEKSSVCSAEELTPVYLRKSQAERERDAKLQSGEILPDPSAL